MLFDYSEFFKWMDKNGWTFTQLSKETDIPRSTLSNKFNNQTEFKISEILDISSVTGVKDLKRYFFTKKVQ